jgi:hypothetical protein
VIVAELAALLGLEIDESKWEKGHELVESLHHAVEAFVGVEAVGKLKEMVEGTVESAVQAKHLSEQLGISTDAVQELGYAADVTGVSSEAMQGAMRHLARGLQEVQKGSGPAVEAFQELGIHAEDLKGKSLDETLGVLADRFSKMPDGAQKAALSLQLFGREGGARMVPLLNKGSAGIAQLRTEAEKLGFVMDKEGVESAENFEIAQKRLGATLIGLRNTAVQALLPTLQDMVTGLQGWIAENREAIASTLEEVIRGVAEAFHLVGETVSFVTGVVQEHRDIVLAVLAGVGAAIAAFAVQAAIEWAIAFWPVALFVAVIAAVALGIKKLGELIAGQALTWEELWDSIVDGFQEVQDWIEGFPGRVWEWMQSVATSIKDAFTDAFDWAVQKAKDAWHAIENTPVIGQIIRGGEWLVNHATDLAGVGSNSLTGGLSQQLQAQAPGASGGDTTITFGDMHFHVNAEGTPATELDQKIANQVSDQMKDMIRGTYNSIGGGRKAGQ